MSVSKSPIDRLGERLTRKLAGYSSRRSFIARLGMALAAAPVLPLLPVARAKAADAPKTDFERYAQATDATKCSYWKYCGSDGVLCSCCGGGSHTCPPGAEPSPVSWIGTCINPQDRRAYVIAYRDCCGKPACSAGKSCWCDGADREMPIYRSTLNNDIIWCFGNSSATYHCSTAALVGLANSP
ncbi:MAG: methylamine dehydrogenase light chain [Gammaproteobacteria bacterium]